MRNGSASGPGGRRRFRVEVHDQKILRFTQIHSDLVRRNDAPRGMELLLHGFFDDLRLNVNHEGSLAVATGRVFLVEKTFY